MSRRKILCDGGCRYSATKREPTYFLEIVFVDSTPCYYAWCKECAPKTMHKPESPNVREYRNISREEYLGIKALRHVMGA